MKISVLGCGRWGSFIAWYLCNHGHEVYSWGPEDDYSYKVLKETGKNEYVNLDERIRLTCDLEEAVNHAEVIVISISSQGLRGFMKRITAYDVSQKNFVRTYCRLGRPRAHSSVYGGNPQLYGN